MINEPASVLRTFQRVLRIAVAVGLVLTVLSLGHSMLTVDAGATASPQSDGVVDNDSVGPPQVVATVDAVGPGQLTAYDANGSVAYHNDSWWIYHDVDPIPGERFTVSYVASGTAPASTCAGDSCLRNAIERVNLTTGDVEQLHAWSDTRNGSTQTHDVDRVNESVFVVADISFPDRVYMVNVTSGEEIWEWRVSDAYEPSSGGDYPSDWSHINDVEYLDDGRVMANLRNQDQVVFIEPGSGVQEDWTLGTDGEHATLFEAHNPDYIPPARGGPAVVVADSENNRLVEYQRVEGRWEQTWTWQDQRIQWPRDADRLPSGRTLVADSHGKRLLSVAEDGSIAWQKEFPTGSYDVELLGTGDESAGGHSARELDLASRQPGSPLSDGNTSMTAATVGPSLGAAGEDAVNDGTGGSSGPVDATVGWVVHGLVSLVPPLILHGLLFAAPGWVTALDVALGLGTVVLAVTWIGIGSGRWLLPRIRRVVSS
jgi:hypothetical protein